MDNICENCAYYSYDDESEEYVCMAYLDEDDVQKLLESHYKNCPYFRDGDEYKIARKQ